MSCLYQFVFSINFFDKMKTNETERKKNLRTFIGISMSEEMKEFLAQIQQQCQKNCKRGNFTEKQNFHMTLHFLGETTKYDLDGLKQAVYETAQKKRAFALKLNKIGIFRREERGIIWVGVEENKEIFHLYEVLERNLSKQGFAREKKPLRPHITLVREAVPYGCFLQMEKNVVVEQREILVESITLFESTRIKGKLLYRPIFTQNLIKKNL